jgi:hypothetical protein
VSRKLPYGVPIPPPRSVFTQERVVPDRGYTDLPDILAGPTSVISGQNCWLWQERVTPRPRLVNIQNCLADIPTGAFQYYDVTGTQFPMLFSRSTAAYQSGGTWNPLTYVSGVSNNPPTGGIRNPVFGTSVYLPRADANIAVWVNGVDPAFAWAGPTSGNNYSTLSQSYIAADVTLSDNRLIYWNIRYLSSTSQLVTRVAWTAAGNPEDTTSIVGPGYTDLLDMRGVGTRCFTIGDNIVVATDHEIWRGRFVGEPYTYDFQPITRQQGIPFPRAAILVPEGLVWLGDDFMIYRLGQDLSGPTAIGQAIQRTLHLQAADPALSFFGYHADAKMLTLYYTDTAGSYPQRGLTLNLGGQWMPQKYAQKLVVGFQATASSGATTWGALVGPLTGNILTYNQLLGQGSYGFSEAVAASSGTAYIFDPPHISATSDDGVAVPEEVTLGPFFTAIVEQRKYIDTVRLDVQADVASTLSVALSGDNGLSFPGEVSFAVSATSNGSQYVVRPGGVSAVNPLVRIRSTGGAWNIYSVTGKARLDGEVF